MTTARRRFTHDKPRIRFSSTWWWCKSAESIAVGKTPAEAYDAWTRAEDLKVWWAGHSCEFCPPEKRKAGMFHGKP